MLEAQKIPHPTLVFLPLLLGFLPSIPANCPVSEPYFKLLRQLVKATKGANLYDADKLIRSVIDQIRSHPILEVPLSSCVRALVRSGANDRAEK
jgi:hypothetical protein